MNLVREIDELGIQQIVYNPIREEKRIGKNKINFKVTDSNIMYSLILNNFTDRILYRKKIHKILKDIEAKVDLSKITCIHAHTWYSDGGVAYLLSKKYNIPYIVAIRNTDLNLFFKYFIHERSFGKKILESAKNIITISEVYKNRVLSQKSLSDSISKIKSNVFVIPNGVDPFWLENNTYKNQNLTNRNFKLLFIGNFNPGKNVLNLVKAVNLINQNQPNTCSLTLVGGGGGDHKKIIEEIKGNPVISFEGKVTDQNELLTIYRNHDLFVMPSRAETFGLVYIEAMLQGLPILYTTNEGIDGFYMENIGEKVSKEADVNEIKQTLMRVMKHYNSYEIPIQKLIENHDWKKIVIKYIKLYTS